MSESPENDLNELEVAVSQCFSSHKFRSQENAHCRILPVCWELLHVGNIWIRNTSKTNNKSTYLYGCGSKCKVWIKPRSHKRSRPLIQTPDPDLSKGLDPDLWSRPLEWYYLWASWCLQLFNLPSSQATNCFKATVPSCQTSKLHLLQSHAAKQSSCQAATTLSSCQTATFLKQPSCLAAKLTLLQGQAAKQPRCPLAAFTLLSFSCHTASKLQYTQKSGFNSRPRPIQTRIQTRSRPQPAPCISV